MILTNKKKIMRFPKISHFQRGAGENWQCVCVCVCWQGLGQASFSNFYCVKRENEPSGVHQIDILTELKIGELIIAQHQKYNQNKIWKSAHKSPEKTYCFCTKLIATSLLWDDDSVEQNSGQNDIFNNKWQAIDSWSGQKVIPARIRYNSILC